MEQVTYTKITNDLIEEKTITPPVPQIEEVKTATYDELLEELNKELQLINQVMSDIAKTNDLEGLQARADAIQAKINNLNSVSNTPKEIIK